MSLINDALKRATSRQPTTIGIDKEPAAPMQPVEDRPRPRGLPWYFIPAVLAIIAAACWFILKGVQAHRQAKDPAGSPVLVKAREPKADTPEPASTPTAQAPLTTPTGVSPTPPTSNGAAPTETSPTATAASPALEAPPEPPKPAYKLQGIFFRPGNPSAMVNGKTVSVGSQIDGATVKAITRDNLTIEVNGQTTVLTLN